MNYDEYFEILLNAYRSHGVLLSGPEIAVVENADIEPGNEMLTLIKMSREQRDQDLTLQIEALAESERDKKSAEKALDEARALSAQLEERNRRTEGDLQRELDLRVKQERTDFQRQFATYLVFLIAASLLLPYLGSLVSVGEKITDSTNNLTLLLIQTLGVVAGFLFNRKSSDSGD